VSRNIFDCVSCFVVYLSDQFGLALTILIVAGERSTPAAFFGLAACEPEDKADPDGGKLLRWPLRR
jgi:hypothetical protein